MRSPSAIAGKTLPGTPSTRNLVVGVGAVEGVSYGDGVARVGLTRGEVYYQLEKANKNKKDPRVRTFSEPIGSQDTAPNGSLPKGLRNVRYMPSLHKGSEGDHMPISGI